MADERAIEALPFVENWKVQKATTFYKAYKLELDGSAWNLSNAAITLQVKNENHQTLLNTEAEITSASTGEFEFSLTTAQTNMDAGEHHYGVKLALNENDSNFPNATFLILKGLFIVEDNVFSDEGSA